MLNQEASSNMDHHNIEVVNHLSNAVTLLDQKATLSDKDIRAKKEILSAIRRLTTIPKMNPIKINELLSIILSKLKVQNLLHLRAVCSNWKSTIEAICALKKCLKLYGFADSIRDLNLKIRFFGTIKLEQFVELKMKCLSENPYNSCYNPLEEKFCTFLGQTFPNVDHLIVDINLNHDSIPNLNKMLEKFWPNLNSFSLNNRYIDLSNFCFNKVKRLDLSGSTIARPNPELIAQLEHFSCIFMDQSVLRQMPQLGQNCISFCFAFQKTDSVVLLDQWFQRNSSLLLANITYIGLFWIYDSDESLIRLICSNFPALQVLSVRYSISRVVFNSATCAQLAKLSHLTKLTFGFILFDLDSLESSEIRKRLSSIRVLNLVNFAINETRDDDFDGDRFCRILASIFSNISKLAIFSNESPEVFRNKIRDNLKHFGKFLKFRFDEKLFC